MSWDVFDQSVVNVVRVAAEHRVGKYLEAVQKVVSAILKTVPQELEMVLPLTLEVDMCVCKNQGTR
jgi:hypothetical protein